MIEILKKRIAVVFWALLLLSPGFAYGEVMAPLEITQEFGIVETTAQEARAWRRISDCFADALRSNPKIQPVLQKFELNSLQAAKWLGKFPKTFKWAFAITRAVGGGGVKYWSLGVAARVGWVPKFLVGGAYGTVTGLYQWKNQKLQYFIEAPLGQLLFDNRISRWMGLHPEMRLAKLMDRDPINVPSMMIRSGIVDLSITAPQRVVIAYSALAAYAEQDHVNALAQLFLLLAPGVGSWEIVWAKFTRLWKETSDDPETREGMQVMCDFAVMGLALIGAIGEAHFHMKSYAVANTILYPLAALGILSFLNEYASPYLVHYGPKVMSLWKQVLPLDHEMENVPCPASIAMGRRPKESALEVTADAPEAP